MNNKYSKELMHFSLGEIFSNHKYIRREENTDGQKSKFRYFYDNIKSSVTDAISSFADNWKAGIPKSVKESVSTFTSNIYNKIQTGYKAIENLGSSSYTSVSNLKETVNNTFYRATLGLVGYKPKYDISEFDVPIATKKGDEGVYVAKESDNVKYIGKIKQSNGKTRYYYSVESFKRAIEIYKYQDNEPSFMKSIKEIDADEDKMPTEKEDAYVVNPGHGTKGTNRTINCANCTIAYELRRRGYDVQAKDVPSTDRNIWDTMECFGIDAKFDQSTLVRVDKQTYDTLKGSGIEVKQSTPYGDRFYMEANNIAPKENENVKNVSVSKLFNQANKEYEFGKALDSVKDSELIHKITNSIKEKFNELPGGSRGDMTVMWTQLGGHSVSWDKSFDGTVRIIDTQVNRTLYDSSTGDEWLLNDMVRSLAPYRDVTLYRYDNMQIESDKILDWVEERK